MEKPTFSRVKRAQEREKVLRYSIRKYGFGAASVAVAALYLFMGRGAVYAAETSTGATAPETTEMAADPNEGEEEEPESPEELAKYKAAFEAGVEAIQAAKAEQLKLFEGLPEDNKKVAAAFFENLAEKRVAALSEAYQQGADDEELQDLAAKSVQEINSAIDAFSPENPESNEVDQAISEAKEAIKTAQTEKLLAIRAASHLTETEQENLTKTVKELSSQALLGLDQIQGELRTLDTVNEIKTGAVEAIQSVEVPAAPKPVDLSKAKEAAKQELDKELNQFNQELDKDKVLSDNEKTETKDIAKNYINQTKDAIEKTQSEAEIEETKATGVAYLDSIYVVGVENSQEEVHQAAADKKKEIEGNTELSKAEMDAAKKQVETAVEKADKAFDATPAEIASEEQETEAQNTVYATRDQALKEIEAVKPVGVAKAKEAIKTAQEAKKAAIMAADYLDQAEQEKLTKLADQLAKIGLDSLEQLPSEKKTQEAVTELKEGAVGAIESVEIPAKPMLDRTVALKAIEDAKAAQIEKVNGNEGISEDEVADAKAAIEEEAGKAVKAVNDATTQDAINKASQDGVAEIKTVNPVGKEFAMDEIDIDLADKKAEIAKDTKLSDEQKKTITAALDKGAQEIREAIGVLPEYGDTDEEATGVEQQIKKLVDGFKEALKQATQEMPKEEIPAPKEDETADKPAGEMKPEENPSTPTPKEETPAPVDRTAALKAIEDAKMAQGQAVEDNEVLSENEVTAAKDKIAKAEETAKKAINEATSSETVEKAKEAGLAAIKAINPVGKEVPIDDLQDAATSRKAEIAKNDKLTPAEKEAANKKIDASVDKIVKGIKATLPSYVDTPEDVEEMNQLILNLVNKFKAGLEKVGVPTTKEEPKAETPEAPKVDRTAALKAIEDAKTEQIEKVNNNEGISESEAAAALTLIEEEAGKAVKAVNEATTQAVIDKASQAGVAKVKAVNPVGKEFALDEITTDLDAKKAEIAKNTQLSDEQKKTIATELDQAAELIKASINSLPAYGETAKAAKDTEDKILELVQGFKEALKEATPETPKAETPAPKENPKLAEFKKAVKAAQEKKLAAIKAADYLGADKQKELEEQLNTLVSLILTGLEETPAEELTDANKESMLADIEGIEVPAKPADKPKADEPVAPSKPEDKPKTDEPVTPSKPEDKPKTDEPVTPSKPEDKPKTDEPVAPSKPEDKPKADEPVAPSKPVDKPKADELATPSKPEGKPQTDTPTTGTTPKTEAGKATETSAPAVSTTPVAPTMRTLKDSASRARISATSQSLAGVDHLAVEKVKAAVLEGKEYDAFDIELRDAQDKAVQPHGAVTVTLPARKAVEAVYYIDANNKLASQSFIQEGDMVTFTTDHFSVYALVYKADQAPASKTDSKESKKELPNTGDTTPTVSFLVGIGLALMGVLALKHKED